MRRALIRREWKHLCGRTVTAFMYVSHCTALSSFMSTSEPGRIHEGADIPDLGCLVILKCVKTKQTRTRQPKSVVRGNCSHISWTYEQLCDHTNTLSCVMMWNFPGCAARCGSCCPGKSSFSSAVRDLLTQRKSVCGALASLRTGSVRFVLKVWWL